MAPAFIFLTGSPRTQQVLEERELLEDTVLPQFQHEGLSLQETLVVKLRDDTPRWSVIPTRNDTDHVRTARAHGYEDTTIYKPQTDLQRSLSEAAGSQPLHGDEKIDAEDLESFLETSLRDVSFESDLSRQETQHAALDAHILEMSRVQLTDISEIPNAAYLRDIEPQTMTVNLLVGIVEDPHFRTVFTRVRRQNVTLVELLVGDHTKAGFGFNLWLGPDNGVNSPYFAIANALQRGQILVLRNVALRSFRDRVYGQNIGRDLTRIEIVHRRCRGARLDIVRQWTSDHVPIDMAESSNSGGRLPLDTQ